MTEGGTQDIFETPSRTPNFRTELAAQLAVLMPEVIADGKIDVEKIKELLGDDAGDDRERFGLFWPGKKRALRAAQEPTTATLRPDFENSKDWDTTKNVFIEGDNLEVLKILQKHYHGKVKLIYIDPPYNTGKDFVYPDNFKEGLETYLEWTRQVNEEGRKVSTNSETEGRYHSNWLNMMYPRLKLARNLLTHDGVIFISIDDNEQENLKRMCNEVFGEANFISTIAVHSNPRGRQSALYVAPTHEYLHVYARNSAQVGIYGESLTEEQKSEYSRVDLDGRRYREIGLRLRGGRATAAESPTLHYPIYVHSDSGQILVAPPAETEGWVEVAPYFSDGTAGTWRWSPSKVSADVDQLVARQVRGTGGESRWDVFQKDYLSEDSQRKLKSLWLEKEINYDRSKDDIKRIGLAPYFDYAKPVSLLRKIIATTTRAGDTVLDFFAGSATTAHAMLQVNAHDQSDRNFILVQLPEPLDANSEATKAGFRTIAEVARARVVHAGAHAEAISAGVGGERTVPLDVGFRAFRLADTNFAKWRATSDIDAPTLQQYLLDIKDSAADSAQPETLLIEILLKQGYSLTELIADTEVSGLKLKAVGEGLVLAYLDELIKPTLDQLRAVVAEKPARFIILEDAFHGDDELKTNLSQECKSRGVELWTA